MRRFTVMGFTEAELGFVLAAVFAAIAGATLVERDELAGTAPETAALRRERDELKKQLAETRQELQHTRDRWEAAQKKLKEIQEKSSTKTPHCWEKGLPREPLGEVVVLGANRFRLDGNDVDIDWIGNRFRTQIAQGKSLGCRFGLRARPSETVNAVDQSRGVWRLRQFFDVDDRVR